MERIKTIISVALPMWTGILLIYTFEMNPLIGFFSVGSAMAINATRQQKKAQCEKIIADSVVGKCEWEL